MTPGQLYVKLKSETSIEMVRCEHELTGKKSNRGCAIIEGPGNAHSCQSFGQALPSIPRMNGEQENRSHIRPKDRGIAVTCRTIGDRSNNLVLCTTDQELRRL